MQKRGKSLAKMKAIVDILLAKETLPPKNRDHQLGGSLSGHRDCHVEPDWILIYKLPNTYPLARRVLGRFAPGTRRASGPVPVIADVRQKNLLRLTTTKVTRHNENHRPRPTRSRSSPSREVASNPRGI